MNTIHSIESAFSKFPVISHKIHIGFDDRSLKIYQILCDLFETSDIILSGDRLSIRHYFTGWYLNSPYNGIVEDQRVFPDGAIKNHSPKPDKTFISNPAGTMHNAAMSKGRAAAYHHFWIRESMDHHIILYIAATSDNNGRTRLICPDNRIGSHEHIIPDYNVSNYDRCFRYPCAPAYVWHLSLWILHLHLIHPIFLPQNS